MVYKISNTAIKSQDWRIVSVTDLAGVTTHQCSVNRTNKKGEVFALFDTIVDGANIEANLWLSPAGKAYLFAPKPASTGDFKRSGASGGAITKNMDRKEASIGKFQDSKDFSIRVASTFTAAWNSAIAHYNKRPNDLTSMQDLFEQYREYYWNKFEVADSQYPPFAN